MEFMASRGIATSSRGGRALRAALVMLALAAMMVTSGCRRRTAQTASGPDESADYAGGGEAASEEPGPPPADWPRVLVIAPGTGPALFLGHQSNAAAVGYLNPGVRVRLESSPTNGRVEVLVAGALATKGWVPIDRVGAYTLARGRIEGTRAYVGVNDLVGVVGADGENMRVEVRPWLGGANFIGPFTGTFPRAQLGDEPIEIPADQQLSEGECFTLPPGQPVPVYERPGGETIATLPALDPPLAVVVLRQRDNWYGVRAGYGPYVTGYLQGPLAPCAGPRPAPEPMAPASEGERPYWMSQESGPLHRVAAGTRVRFHGRTIARLRADGWARELGRQDGDQVDVFVAVDDDVAIRGLVPAESLTLVEAGATPPAATPATPATPAPPPEEEEDLPPELQ